MPQSFSGHPFARHPIAGPLLRLVEARPQSLTMDDSLRVELEVQRHLATLQICHQAEALYGVGAVQQWRAQPLPRIAGPLWQAFDKSRWPLDLVQRYRPSHQHGLGTMAALDLAMTISLDGPESELIVDPRVSALRRLAKTRGH